MDLQDAASKYTRAAGRLQRTILAKHEALGDYAGKPKAKQGYIDIQNREIEAMYEFQEAAAGLIAALNEQVQTLQNELHLTLNAVTTIRKLRREIKKAEIYIRSKGHPPGDWRWIDPERDAPYS